MMWKLVWIVPALAAFGACSDDSTYPSPGPNAVGVRDFFFSPQQRTVAQGTTVTWTWQAGVPHNVTFEDGQGSSATQATGTHTRSFGATGTFRYRCTIHSLDFTSGMSGSVVVQ